MPDNNGMLGDIEFENELNELGTNQLELSKFIARQQHTTQKMVVSNSQRIKTLENREKKGYGITGGVGAMFGVAIATVIDYFMRRS